MFKGEGGGCAVTPEQTARVLMYRLGYDFVFLGICSWTRYFNDMYPARGKNGY